MPKYLLPNHLTYLHDLVMKATKESGGGIMFDEEGNITHITTTHSVHELSVVIDDNYCIEWHVHPKLKGAVQLPSYTDLKIALKRAKGLITKNSEVVGTCNLIVSKLGLIVYRFVAKSHPNPTGFTCLSLIHI